MTQLAPREGIDQNAVAERQVPLSIAEKATCVKDFAEFLFWSSVPVWLNYSQPVTFPPPSAGGVLPRVRPLQDPSPRPRQDAGCPAPPKEQPTPPVGRRTAPGNRGRGGGHRGPSRRRAGGDRADGRPP